MKKTANNRMQPAFAGSYKTVAIPFGSRVTGYLPREHPLVKNGSFGDRFKMHIDNAHDDLVAEETARHAHARAHTRAADATKILDDSIILTTSSDGHTENCVYRRNRLAAAACLGNHHRRNHLAAAARLRFYHR